MLLCFLQAALAETADAIVEVQDKLITSIHSKTRKRRDDLLRASEEAKRRAVEVLEVMGQLVLDKAIPDSQQRNEIPWRIPDEEMATLVDGCRQLRTGDDGSHLSLTAHWYAYTREYSPSLLEKTPFRFASSRHSGGPWLTFDSSTASTAANSGRNRLPPAALATARHWSRR